MSKTNWKTFFDYQFLGSHDLEDVKSKPIFTIHQLKTEKVKDTTGKEEVVLVCYFAEKNVKPMILNKTNCKTIEKLYNSPHVEDWLGKRIQLQVKRLKAFGEMTNALRVCDFIPKSEAEVGISELRKQVRSLLQGYKGEDIDKVKETLNDTKGAGKDDEKFYSDMIDHLKSNQ